MTGATGSAYGWRRCLFLVIGLDRCRFSGKRHLRSWWVVLHLVVEVIRARKGLVAVLALAARKTDRQRGPHAEQQGPNTSATGCWSPAWATSILQLSKVRILRNPSYLLSDVKAVVIHTIGTKVIGQHGPEL